jgi:hypothetical protein
MPWIQAGYPIREPEWKAPLPLLHPVSTAHGAQGWVQDIAWGGAVLRAPSQQRMDDGCVDARRGW